MSAERTLLTHWKACVESRDSACIGAFVDHLIELWDDVVREDAEYTRETGGNVPLLRLEHDGRSMKVEYAPLKFDEDGVPVETGRIDVVFTYHTPDTPRFRQFRRTLRHFDQPSRWAYETVAMFAGTMTEFLATPVNGRPPVVGT